MSFGDILRQQITLNTRQALSSQELHEMVAQQCRQNRDAVIASGQAPQFYTTTVDGRRGAAEETARLMGGTIVYQFSSLAQAANWALAECKKRSPVASGNFRASWVLLVNGVVWPDLDDIPMGAEVWIINLTPYARKIEVGGMQIRVPPGIVEAVRQSVQRRFVGISAAKQFKSLGSGSRDHRGNPVPYILKRAGVASGLSYDKKSKSWGRKHAAYASPRLDRQAGEQMLYPTLILTQKRQ